MKYLMVENPGVCPVEGFTMLGVSTARGQSESIGQFGSGNKHAILTLLRWGIEPIIFLGGNQLVFETEPAMMGNKPYTKIFSKFSGKRNELSMALEYGEMDWNGIDMACREFISNALDASGGKYENIYVSLTDCIPSRKHGTTRIYIPATPEIIQFYNRLGERFLHVGGKQNHRVLLRDKPGPARIYRKGVFVREASGASSHFDYNFGEELKIDEARNLDDYACKGVAVHALAGSTHISHMFSLLSKSEKLWEEDASTYSLSVAVNNYASKWRTEWQKLYGDASVAMEAHGPFIEIALKKGHPVITIKSQGWYDALVKAGIPSVMAHCDNVNSKGHQIGDATPEVLANVDKVWKWLEYVGMTKGKSKPITKFFTILMEGGTVINGYYENNTIFMNRNNIGSFNVILEELAHYITGANDNSRDFQQFAFDFGSRFAASVW